MLSALYNTYVSQIIPLKTTSYCLKLILNPYAHWLQRQQVAVLERSLWETITIKQQQQQMLRYKQKTLHPGIYKCWKE